MKLIITVLLSIIINFSYAQLPHSLTFNTPGSEAWAINKVKTINIDFKYSGSLLKKKGKDYLATSYRYEANIDTNGKYQTLTYFNKADTTTNTYTYDSINRLIKIVGEDTGGGSIVFYFEYNGDSELASRILSIQQFGDEYFPTTYYLTEFNYSSTGRIMREFRYTPAKQIEYNTESFNWNNIKIDDWKVKQVMTYEYNGDTIVGVTCIEHNGWGVIAGEDVTIELKDERYAVFKYDDKGNVTEYIVYKAREGKEDVLVSKYQYYYNANGLMTKKQITYVQANTGLERIITQKFSYGFY